MFISEGQVRRGFSLKDLLNTRGILQAIPP
jgi:hypothetical protein